MITGHHQRPKHLADKTQTWLPSSINICTDHQKSYCTPTRTATTMKSNKTCEAFQHAQYKVILVSLETCQRSLVDYCCPCEERGITRHGHACWRDHQYVPWNQALTGNIILFCEISGIVEGRSGEEREVKW